MLNQTFSLLDLPRVLILVLLECALSADNALVIAAIITPLPEKDRNKALWIGISSALVLRLGAIVSFGYFIHLFWMQILGAAYLIYLAILYRVRHTTSGNNGVPNYSLWKAIIRLELTDLVFAIDSIIAALGLIDLSISPGTRFPSKLWIVYLGGIIGLVLMRFAAKILSIFMERFPHLERASHYLMAWVGIKLGIHAIHDHYIRSSSKTFGLYSEIIFWIVAVLILVYGFIPKKSKR